VGAISRDETELHNGYYSFLLAPKSRKCQTTKAKDWI
jgi:hypothetical protein